MPDVKTIRPASHITSQWSGGTTTQIAIYPENTSYIQKNFKWRISSAVVSEDNSTFTPLPGYQRKIMILDGSVILSHDGHHESHLGKYDTDTFSGSWKTHAEGRCTDFNLMYLEKGEGTLLHREIPKGDKKIWPGKFDTTAIYALSGKIDILLEGKLYPLAPKETLLINGKIDEFTARNLKDAPADIIIATVKFPLF